MVGSAVTVVLWTALTVLLAAYLGLSNRFGEIHGPWAGLIGVLLWALLNAFALYLGLAVAAQLETIGAGGDASDIRGADAGRGAA